MTVATGEPTLSRAATVFSADHSFAVPTDTLIMLRGGTHGKKQRELAPNVPDSRFLLPGGYRSAFDITHTSAKITPPEIQSLVPKETAVAATKESRALDQYAINDGCAVVGAISQVGGGGKNDPKICAIVEEGLTQDDGHGICNISEEDLEKGRPWWRLQSIGAILLLQLFDFIFRETQLGIDIISGNHIIAFQGVWRRGERTRLLHGAGVLIACGHLCFCSGVLIC